MINYDHEDGVSVSSKLTSSILTVRNATARHGGIIRGKHFAPTFKAIILNYYL